MLISAAVVSMVIIALERYMKIVHPVYHRNHFRPWMKFAGVILCWANGLLTCVVSDFLFGSNCLSLSLRVGKVGFKYVGEFFFFTQSRENNDSMSECKEMAKLIESSCLLQLSRPKVNVGY